MKSFDRKLVIAGAFALAGVLLVAPRANGAQCDPGPEGSPNRDCCVDPGLILVNHIGGPCGTTQPHKACETGGTCSDQGQCVSMIVPADVAQRCRAPFTNGPCDLGDFCDGTSPDCPTTGDQPCAPGIDVMPTENPKVVDVTCEAAKQEDGKPKCDAKGFEPAAATAVRRSARGAEPEPVCGTRAFTPRVVVPLSKENDEGFLTKQVKLRLNPYGQKLLKHQGSVEMCVVVKIKFAGKILSTNTALVKLTK